MAQPNEVDIIISHRPWIESDWRSAKSLKAIFNVETNSTKHRLRSLCSAVDSRFDSEFSLCARRCRDSLAISACIIALARNVHQAHADFQQGKEKYGLEGT